MSALFVCFGDPSECIGCGGSIYASDDGKGSPPFEAPEGSQVPGRYCTEDCWEEWEEHCIRERERWQRLYGCCAECGFDRQEHDEGCSRRSAGATEKEN